MENQNLNFDFVFLGQSILKYQVPLDIFSAINQIYEQNFYNLAPANKQLVGKIENEHSLFYNGQDQSKMKNHNMLPRNIPKPLCFWLISSALLSTMHKRKCCRGKELPNCRFRNAFKIYSCITKSRTTG